MHSSERIGKLYVVATPIGNLKDITLRALDILKSVDLIACEDTRHTRKLLNYYNIGGKRLVPYHEHNERFQTEKLLEELFSGTQVALVSDAGTPCISDPGYRLVKAARENGIPVVAVPGASSVIAALSVAGVPTDRFLFVGFLPRKEKSLIEVIREIFSYPFTVVAFESPHRLERTLSLVGSNFPEREIVVIRELTKVNEDYARGTAEEVLEYLKERNGLKGEVVLIFPPGREKGREVDLLELLNRLRKEGYTMKEAVREAVEVTGVSKKEVYAEALKVFK